MGQASDSAHKLPLRIQGFHVRWQDLNPCFSTYNPASGQYASQEAANNGSTTSVPDTHMGDLGGLDLAQPSLLFLSPYVWCVCVCLLLPLPIKKRKKEKRKKKKEKQIDTQKFQDS